MPDAASQTPNAKLTPAPEPQALDRIRVVLSRPQHPGNIGAAARAMKTMGLTRLTLVAPRQFPDPEATTRATGAADLLEHATVCGTLEEALAGCVFAVGLTARIREVGPPQRTARVAVSEMIERSAGGDVALVFGNETSGLSNDEVLRCDRTATIPTSAAFSSLNLGAAVQLLSYELRQAALGDTLPLTGATPFESPPATREEVEGFFGHLERVMVASRFMDPKQPKRLVPKLRRLFGRAGLEKDEVNILRGLLTAVMPQVSGRAGAQSDLANGPASSGLIEHRQVRQNAGERQRRWFYSADYDLIVWFEDSGAIAGFELCYDKQQRERSLVWRADGRHAHMAVDSGEQRSGRHKGTPLLVADGVLDAQRLRTQFKPVAEALPAEIATCVLAALEGLAAGSGTEASSPQSA